MTDHELHQISRRIVLQHIAVVIVTGVPMIFIGQNHWADIAFTVLLALNFIIYLIRLYRVGALDIPDHF
jgi:hypothetical protein